MVTTPNGSAMRVATPPSGNQLRVHTPPAPRWGAKDDSWTPFTPRRSSRVAAQRHASPLSPESPTRISRKPAAPIERMRKTRRLSPATSGSDEERNGALHKQHDNGLLGANDATIHALPTPAKTPRTKRQLPKEVLNPASRVLFHGRLANVEDAMPSPRKARKSKALSLNPFMDDERQSASSKIEVYEDSKERIPTVDRDEDNPFLCKPSNPQHASNSRSKRKAEKEMKMAEAVAKDEGLIYVFRGKKIFKKYDNGRESQGEDADNLSDQELRRRAGGSPAPRMSRTSLKPRVLFPSAAQRKAQDAAAEDADEEALTDIEVPSPSVTKKEQPFIHQDAITLQNEPVSDPIPQQEVETSEAQILETDLDNGVPVASQTSQMSDGPENKRLTNTRKPRASSPFDKWSRTKPSVTAPSELKSRKRGASPMEQSSKRVRSQAM